MSVLQGLRSAASVPHSRWVSASRASSAVDGGCTKPRRNTHGTSVERELLYPWHPWAGQQVHVHEVIERGDTAILRCSLSGRVSDRWLEVPAWMFDRAISASWHITTAPCVGLAVLDALAKLLQDTDAPSQSRVTGAASVSHDTNRGDVHAAQAHDTPVRSVLQTCCADRTGSTMASAAGRDATAADQADGALDPRPRRRRARCATGGRGS